MVAKARGDSGKWMCLQCGKEDIRLMIMIKTIKMGAYDLIHCVLAVMIKKQVVVTMQNENT